jgi:hypothetical protein
MTHALDLLQGTYFIVARSNEQSRNENNDWETGINTLFWSLAFSEWRI